MSRTRPPPKPAAAASPANSPAIGAISGEWKAWETGSRSHRTPASSSRRHRASTAASGPETTVCPGPLIAATAAPAGSAAPPALAGGHRRHGPDRRQLGHQPAAGGRQPHPLVRRQHPGGAGGGQLAGAVAQDGRRLHTPALPQRRQAALQGEQRRLGVLRLLQPLDGIGSVEQLGGAAGVDGPSEGRLGLVQAAAHPGVLRPP